MAANRVSPIHIKIGKNRVAGHACFAAFAYKNQGKRPHGPSKPKIFSGQQAHVTGAMTELQKMQNAIYQKTHHFLASFGSRTQRPSEILDFEVPKRQNA